MQNSFLRVLCLLLSMGTATCLEAASRTTCNFPDWDSDKPVHAPQIQAGARWVYTVGDGYPTTELHLEEVQGTTNILQANGQAALREDSSTYTDVNSRRKGNKVLIRFPVTLGDRWEDEFSEEGEFRSNREHYFYDYHEASTSHAAAVEEISVAAGTFKALRIDRIARWTKSKPRPADDDASHRDVDHGEPHVEGLTLTQIWYVPSLGRGVLKAQVRVGSEDFAFLVEDLMDDANSTIVELLAFEDGAIRCDGGHVRLARWGGFQPPIGYPIARNSSWEWALRMHDHAPRRSR